MKKSYYQKFPMKRELIVLLMAALPMSLQVQDRYEGEFCSGEGDTSYLQLIDESFAFFHPNAIVPNLSMIYKPEWDTFVEGAGWGAWWAQNSYGFSYAASPFLQEPWSSILQRSLDLFWDNQGDGRRNGYGDGKVKGMWDGELFPLAELVAPDGCLGDMAAPGQIAYRQGDGDISMHDWFYEATAACVVMQAELLLVGRDRKAVERYLPNMERACDFIEKARDPKNNLFLVGPASNLLAPSFGGVKQPDGSFGKAYLAGLSVTYLAALDRMVELFKLCEKTDKVKTYEHRQQITRASLPKLLAPEGYFVKSVEPNGVKHGVLGQKHFGYLEGVVNADAVALRVASDATTRAIYDRISTFPDIRPFDFLLTNAPALDDTYWSWGDASGPKAREGFNKYGDWVNGGVWGTVEGRAILMYYRLGKFEDIYRSGIRAMKWAKDFRMDSPWSQRGENTNNPWSDSGDHRNGSVVVMVDNFAIPAATVRGLFDYEYKHDRVVLRPRIPQSIVNYAQKHPVTFGQKKLYLSCHNAGTKINSITVNGEPLDLTSDDAAVLYYDDLPDEAHIMITTEGGWPEKKPTLLTYPERPSLKAVDRNSHTDRLPDSLQVPFGILSHMHQALEEKPGDHAERAFIAEAIKCFEAYRLRLSVDPGPGYYRPITAERKSDIYRFYAQAALNMYAGVEKRMAEYRRHGSASQKEIARLFAEAQKQQ